MKFSVLLLLVIASLTFPVMAQSAGAFTRTGDMMMARFGHKATLLPDGKVLIAGGNVSCTLASCIRATNAELYDPSTGAFSNAGLMNTIQPVGGILLPNGKVLFAEGYPVGARASIELYDPQRAEFRIAGTSSLEVVRSAALLNDGRVFMIGYNPSGSGAEIYDPVSEVFAPIVSWPAGNLGFCSVLSVLPDNRVLLDIPGFFDPISGMLTRMVDLQWQFSDDPPANMLLDGKVLLTGGNTDGGNVNWADLFGSENGLFLSTGNMSYVRDGHTGTLLPDGEVLVSGGATWYNTTTRSTIITNSAEIYNPSTGTFSLTASMTTPRLSHAAVLLNSGQVLITGGQLTSPPDGMIRNFVGSSSAELYTPAKLIPAPALFSLSADGRGQGAVWHADTGETASAVNPAAAGDVLSMFTTSLAPGGVVSPQVLIGGRLSEILYVGDAPGYVGYYQVNYRLPSDVTPGPAVPVHLMYLGRSSNEVSIAVR